MRRIAIALSLAAGSAHLAHAEPVLAARTGLGCASCHLNRTGGGARTAYGSGYGARTLPMWQLASGHQLYDGAIGERVRIGFDGRGGYFATFRDPGPYIGEAKLSEANLYFGADLLKDRLAVYLDEHVAPGGASSREAFMLFTLDRAGFYVKGGKFFLPFGLRLQDDEAATRAGTGFTFDTADIGAEVGIDTGGWSTSLAVTNGTSGAAEHDNGKQYVWSGAAVFTLGRIGLSGSFNDLPEGQDVIQGGVFGTFLAGPIVILAEADVIDEKSGGTVVHRGGAGHLEIDGLVHKGLTLRAFAGASDLDRNDAVPRLEQWGLGIDWTPLPGLQIRTIYRARSGPLSVEGANDDQASLEAHVYF